jgi:hypothetical protein
MQPLKVGKNSIALREGQISSYIESVLRSNVNFVEEDIGVYYIFLEENDNNVTWSIDPKDGIWHVHFDGACSNEGNGVRYLTLLSFG